MSDGLARFNDSSRTEAEERLCSCFANRGWAARIAAGRPYSDLDALLAAAESGWSELDQADWIAAVATHPRIGERGGHSPASSEREQSRVMQASEETLAALASENRAYEARFGHVFLIAASGRSADEVLQEVRRRLSNDPAVEVKIAADELRKITRLRLEQLLRS